MNGGNLWQASCQEYIKPMALPAQASVDLLVIGGGFTGCSAALAAAQAGARVLLVEAQEVGHGGSGRNVGLVNAGLWLPPDQVEAALGQEAGQRLNAALGAGPGQVFGLIARHGIACEAVQNGTLHCAHAPKGMADLQARFAQQQRRAAPVQIYDAHRAQQAVGSPAVHGALFDARAGTVQPMGYVRGLARAAQQAGAQICQGVSVQRIAHDGQAWQVHAGASVLRAERLLLATNAYHQGAAGAKLPRLTPVHYFQLATRPLSPNLAGSILPGGEGAWDTGTVMTSYRKDAAGRLILGAMGLPDQLGLHRAWANRALARLFPQVAGEAFDYFWSGRIAMTGDKMPKIQRIGPNGLAVYGYSGRGIAPGTVMGTACAGALLAGDEAGLPLAPIDGYAVHLARTRGLYYETGARLLHALGARL